MNKMKLPKELTTVTPLSKALAMLTLIALPFIGFLVGINFQDAVYVPSNASTYESTNIMPKKSGVACTLDVKLCTDGTYVSRTGATCQFEACPATPSSKVAPKK